MAELNERYKDKLTVSFDERGQIVIKVQGVEEPLVIGLHDDSDGYEAVYMTINNIGTATFEPEKP